MSFKLRINQLTELFNPDHIHRGISLDRLKRLGSINALETHLKTNFHKGLHSDAAEHTRRRAHFGTNHPHVKKQHTLWEIIMNNFDDEIIRIMIAAGFCSLVLGVLSEGWKWGWIEGCSIFFAVAILIALTSVNNYAHEQSFQLFKGETALDVVRTYRGGRLYLLDPEELMVGDIVEVMGGDRLGVDGLLISCEDLLIDESEITGEAVEVKKRVPYSYDRNEGADPFILSSSRVTSGVGKMVVLAVGEHSYYGSLAAKMDEQHVDPPLRGKLHDLSQQINQSGILFGVITFSSLLIHYLYWCMQDQDPMNTLFSKQTLSHLVEAILVTFTIDIALPESLPLLVTIALAKTAKQLQKQNIFVKQLKECETMGNIDSLCLTKTGFISKNLLSVSEIFVEERTTNIVSREIMSANTCHLLGLAIVMNTQATPKFIESNGSSLSIEHVGNKTESALLEMAYRLGYHYQRFRLNSKVRRIYSTTVPRKKMATIYRDENGKLFLFVKGSPKFLLAYCRFLISRNEQVEAMDIDSIQKINDAINHFSRTNQKTIIVAYKELSSMPTRWSQVEKNLVLIAVVGIRDVIRDGVKETIKECEELGINVRMLSSEKRNDAIGGAKELGVLPENWVERKRNDYTVLEGSDFRELVAALTKEDKTHIERKLAIENFKMVKETLKVIYRASAEDKLLLAIGLKECGHVVAVAGNGTNDTQALRKADVSISMGLTCNQTAKEASDIVILDDRFASILKAVKWGKHTFNIIKKFLSLQLTINLVAAIMALLGAIFLGESPLHPMQMLWINIIIDIFGSISLILEKPLEMEINRTPYRRRDKILTTDMIKLIVVQAFVQVVILSGILFAGPALLGIVSSVSVEEWNIETGKHESVFFNTFIMLQIFNEYNLRVLTFDKINVFEGLLQNPLFLCFSVTSFILQLIIIKYGGQFLHLTELSFKENLLCLILGSLSISGNICFKILIPQNIRFSMNGLEVGEFKYYWNKKHEKQQKKKVEKDMMSYIPLPQAELEILSPRFSKFLSKRRAKHAFSYIDQRDSNRGSIDQECFMDEQTKQL